MVSEYVNLAVEGVNNYRHEYSGLSADFTPDVNGVIDVAGGLRYDDVKVKTDIDYSQDSDYRFSDLNEDYFTPESAGRTSQEAFYSAGFASLNVDVEAGVPVNISYKLGTSGSSGTPVTVDWGDGSSVTCAGTAPGLHSYAESGTYHILMSASKKWSFGAASYNSTSKTKTGVPQLTSVTAVQCQQLTAIGDYAFVDCPNLRTLMVSQCPAFDNISKSSLSGDYKEPSATNRLNQLSVVDCQAFKGNSGTILQLDKIPALTSIGPDAFKNAGLLTAVQLYDSNVREIQDGAFEGCVKLAKVEVFKGKSRNRLRRIRSRAFSGTKINSIAVGTGSAFNFAASAAVFRNIPPVPLMHIASDAFGKSAIKSVKAGMFSGVKCIADIDFLPASVASVNDSICQNCVNLQSFQTQDDSPLYRNSQKQENHVFNQKRAFSGCSKLERIELYGITSVKQGQAFILGCTSLRSIYYPDSIVGFKGITSLIYGNTTDVTSASAAKWVGPESSAERDIMIRLPFIGYGRYYTHATSSATKNEQSGLLGVVFSKGVQSDSVLQITQKYRSKVTSSATEHQQMLAWLPASLKTVYIGGQREIAAGAFSGLSGSNLRTVHFERPELIQEVGDILDESSSVTFYMHCSQEVYDTVKAKFTAAGYQSRNILMA